MTAVAVAVPTALTAAPTVHRASFSLHAASLLRSHARRLAATRRLVRRPIRRPIRRRHRRRPILVAVVASAVGDEPCATKKPS